MAGIAKSHSIIDAIAQIGVFSPRFYMMYRQSTAANTTFLAGKVIPPNNGYSPCFVFVLSSADSAGRSISFVSRMFVTFLKVGCIFPFWHFRTALDSVYEFISIRTPLFKCFLSALFATLFGFIGAFFRTELSSTRWGTAKSFSALWARRILWRESAFSRTVYAFSFCNYAWSDLEFFTAPSTRYSDFSVSHIVPFSHIHHMATE